MAVYESSQTLALEIFRESLRASHPVLLDEKFIRTSDDGQHGLPNDPDKLQYLRELIAYILYGRKIVATYNVVLLAVLAVVIICHLYAEVRDRNRRMVIEGDPVVVSTAEQVDHRTESVASSSSSSTLEGLPTSEDILKAVEIDVERQPLLGYDRQDRRNVAKTQRRCRSCNLLRSWLTYQPPPIPLINRSLPSNGTSICILAFYSLNLFYQLYGLPLKETRHLFAFADRAGLVFVANVPLLYLLGAKNQPLKLLTGYSYESLNILHRRVGELMCLAAAAHVAGVVSWVGWFAPDFLRPQVLGGSWYRFLTRPLVVYGITAFVAYEALYFTSLASFRRRWYEIFLAAHVALQSAALVFLWLHFRTARPFVCAALAIFLVDRLVYRLNLKSARLSADVRVLEDGETVLLSADWDIPRHQHSSWRRWWGFLFSRRQSILHGWHPADHVFVTIPELGRTHALQAHPFTIASAAPERDNSSPSGSSSPEPPPPAAHAWLSLLIRAQSGFTSDLLRHARHHHHHSARVSVRLDGPYGSREPLRALGASDVCVLVAGGSGIAVAFPLAWDLARSSSRSRGGAGRRVFLCWVVHSRAQRAWVPEERLRELGERWGVRVAVPEPTAEAGRPDVPAYVADLASRFRGERIGVLVSGPDGLNRSVRNACAREIRRGADVRLQVEKFGW